MRIIIIGGGIGGLCTAIALQQRGFEAHVYEAAPALHPVGAGIWLPTNAMQVLDRLGLSGAVEAKGVALERIELHDAGRGLLQGVDLEGVREQFGHTTISLHRAVLQRVLAAHVQPETLHLGKTCTGFAEEGAGVAARFHDGTAAEADVLVGADGIHSVIRKQLFPAVALRSAGQTCYLGVADLELPAPLARTSRETWGRGKRFGFSALSPSRVYWFAPISAPSGFSAAPGTRRAQLLRTFASFPAPIPDILRHTEEAAILQVDLQDLPALDRWWQGRVVLLGDAAHAMTPNLGQGGAQAIEDAYVLASCLAQEADAGRAFAAYTEIRRPKARAIAARAWQLGKLAHLERRLASSLRNFILRHLPASLNRRQLEQLYALNY